MTSDLSHERCSELLSGYARAELGEPDARLVSAHLESCPECRAELAGLRALIAPPAEKLTGDERARLHRGIEAALDIGGAARSPAPVAALEPHRQRWGRRAVQA